MTLLIRVANDNDITYAVIISKMIEEASRIRRTGITIRDTEDINKKILEGNAVVAFLNGIFAGFSYLDKTQDEFIANSGMIILPEYRHSLLANLIKTFILKLSSYKFTIYNILGITTTPSVYKMNISLGFYDQNLSKISLSHHFWYGCYYCRNYRIIETNYSYTCFCVVYIYEIY